MIQTFIGKKTILFVKEKKQKISSSLVERRRRRKKERKRETKRPLAASTHNTNKSAYINLYILL